jgi:hypothetical protein
MEMMSIESYEMEDTNDKKAIENSRSYIQSEYKKKIQMLTDSYENSALKCNADEVDPNAPPLADQTDIITYRANICKQYFLLLARSILNLARIPLASYVKLISIIVISVMIILIF